MARRLVMDCSVCIKWYVPEPGADAARALLTSDAEQLLAPDLIIAELGNVLWKRQRNGTLSLAEARRMVDLIADPAVFPLIVVPAAMLLPLALVIAAECDRTVYDALYVALAVVENAQLVTADHRLANALAGTRFAHYVMVLS